MRRQLLQIATVCALLDGSVAVIDRQQVVRAFNVKRSASSNTTPLQVGNGDFAFGVDITGLQTFHPFGTLSTWAWHNFSLPTTPGQTSIGDFSGLNWATHGRLVNYNQPNPAEKDISTWLIQNPQRVNLARIGFDFGGKTINETRLGSKFQTLDLWTGRISSSFVYDGQAVEVETYCHPQKDVLGIHVKSALLDSAAMGISFDFPYPNRNKFDAPFVGVWDDAAHHNASGNFTNHEVAIAHDVDGSRYYLAARWDADGRVAAPPPGKTRHVLTFSGPELKMAIGFGPAENVAMATYAEVAAESERAWKEYWEDGAFVDLTSVKSPNATELQRRIILSQYLMMVNSASSNPPQESGRHCAQRPPPQVKWLSYGTGLVNNGWYGKFHMEMCFWHTAQFARWNRFPLLWRSMPNTYQRFLRSSVDRAAAQGYKGARWPKMTDPTGRSAPGEINSLLIWQQPHPLYFAELEYRSYPNDTTLKAWDEIITATADFMASFAFFNTSTGVYDLGPPLYPVSENTNPNATMNPTFELAYWRFGLDVAARWKYRQGKAVPAEWTAVRDGLARLPTLNGTHVVYEGIPGMWTDPKTTFDHPAMAGVFGWLPPPASGPPLNMTVVRNTAAKIKQAWALDQSYGWDFSLLAMNALRLGDADQAIEYLLHPAFEFDDAGYPVGGSRVATPYFPNSASLLLALAMMAGGWDGAPGPHFPKRWEGVAVEGFVPGI